MIFNKKAVRGEKMKKPYEVPNFETELFSVDDVITTSGGGGDEPIITPPIWEDISITPRM